MKQAAFLVFNDFVIHLKAHGYRPTPNTIEIWTPHTQQTKFCSYVDNFGVKYYTKEDAEHL